MRERWIIPMLILLMISSCSLGLPSFPKMNNASRPIATKPSAQPKAVKTNFQSCDPKNLPLSEGIPSVPPTPIYNSSVPYPNNTMRSLADQLNLYIGAAGDARQYSNIEYVKLLTHEFNMVAVENAMKWHIIHPEPDIYDFSRGDALVAFAKIYDLAVYGHVLVWDYAYPTWVTETSRTRDEWIQLLCEHIKTVASHYQNQIYAWDVVNEAFNNDGSLRNTLWMQKIGPEYVAMAFQWAREADPNAHLILNDHFAEGMNSKSEAIYSLAKGLLMDGVPIDGVGMQMHLLLWGPPTTEELLMNMKRLSDLDLDVHITEMDLRMNLSSESPKVKTDAQTDTYRRVFDSCLAVPRCKVFVTWGLTDKYSWIPDYTGYPDTPLLFDENFQPKPAYYEIMKLLQEQFQ